MSSPEKKFMVAGGREEELDLIRRTLAESGYLNVIGVDNGPDALRLIEEGGRFFVFAAWELPGLGGLRLAREIRRTDHAADEPCVLIVPEHHEAELLMAEGSGVSGFLFRPVTRRQVRARVEELMTGRPEADWPRQLETGADRLVDMDRPEDALAQYERVLEAGRQRMAGLHTETGITYLKLGRKEDAVKALEAAAGTDPKLARAQGSLGRAYLETGRPEKASRALEEAVRLDPQNQEVQTDLAESLLQSGQLERAENLFRKLLRRRPEDGFLLNRLGIALRRQAKYDRAIAHYGEAIRIKPGDENLFFNLGRSYYESGDMPKARSALNRALEINPELEEARRLLSKIQT